MKLKVITALLLSMITFHFSALAATEKEAVEVLSFKEWRSNKQNVTQAKYSKLQQDYLVRKDKNPSDPGLKALYLDLKGTKSRLDDISELTVSDYFIGYLSQVKDQKQAFKAVAGKLDESEVAELMTAYADSLLKTTGDGISTAPKEHPSEASK